MRRLIFICIHLTIFVSVALGIGEKDTGVCNLPRDTGVCYALYVAWYYDPKIQECVEFLYGGCGGNGNRFKTETACYAHCQEKLINLYPPKNVTVAYVQESQVFLYWHAPRSYVIHDVKMNNSTYTYLNLGKNQTAVKGSGVTQLVIAPINIVTTTPRPRNETKTNITNGNDTSPVLPKNSGTVTLNNSKETTANPGEVKGSDEAVTDYMGKDRVPFHLARLINYEVSFMKNINANWTTLTLNNNVTEYKVTGLTPMTEYTFIVSAIYASGTKISAPAIVKTTTKDHGLATNCYCDPFGTIGGYKACDLSLHKLPWCKCKSGFVGLFCEMCSNGFYRTAMSLPCHKCPCSKISSSGSCHFVEGYLHCTRCRDGYDGNMCQRCRNGYYRNLGALPSECTKCVGCHNVAPGLVCDPFNGKCVNCHFNTSGDRCDRCLTGFVGDPLKNISCQPIVEKYKPPKSGVIAAICVGIIILLSAVVGFIVYCRMRSYPKRQPFWTVELAEGHDDVCFRSEDDEANDRDDDFGNSYRFKPASKQAYQKLKT